MTARPLNSPIRYDGIGKVQLLLSLSIGLCLLLAGPSCFVSGRESARLQLTLAMEDESGGAGGMRDEYGLLDITQTPLYVAVEVSASDLPAAYRAEWPTPASATTQGEVSLRFEVAAGTERRITATAYRYSNQMVKAYGENAPLILDLPGGVEYSIAITLVDKEVGTLTGELKGPLGGEVVQVAPVDRAFGLLLPAVTVQNDNGRRTYTCPKLPVGREFWLRTILDSGRIVDLPYYTKTLTQAGETAILDLSVE